MGGHNLEDYETLHVLKEGTLHFACHLDTSEAQISALSDALQTAKSGDEE